MRNNYALIRECQIVSKIVYQSQSEWLRQMGTKEAQLRALREQRRVSGVERKDTELRNGEGREPTVGGQQAGDAAPVPRGPVLPVRPRGRPLDSEKDKSLRATEPWKKCDPPVSRPTWFRRKRNAKAV
jgi:hypothetical protein